MPDAKPLPGWPRYLSRDEAAAYVGVSASTFDDEVLAGWWPAPRRRGLKGGRCTWDRLALDAFADRAAGLGLPAPLPPGDAAGASPDFLAAAEAAALQGVKDAAPKHRPKQRQQKAA